MIITSKSNAQFKRIKKLLASSKERSEEGVFVVEGERIACEAPVGFIETVVVSERYKGAIPEGGELMVFSDDLFKALSDTVNPQGIMAVIRQPAYDLKDIISEAGDKALYVILDDIRDPGNLGTIVRTAEAAGAKAVIMSPGCADIFNPKVIRSTMGSIYRVPFAVSDLKEAVGFLKAAGVVIYGTSLEASRYHNEIDYGDKNAFVIGNEARGISPEVLSLVSEKIKIPMAGQVESLNAAISCAIVMYGAS